VSKKWINHGVVAAVALAGVTAALLALVGTGKAASPNICATASTATTNASCVAELVVPHVITANGDAVSITSFTNQSGAGGATATHVVLTVTFPAAVTVKSISALVDSSPITATCTPAPLPASATSASCPVGTIAGGHKAQLIVRFSTATGGTLEGSAAYGEAGNDSLPPRPNGTVNDTQKARDSLGIAAAGAAQGTCFDASQFLNGGVATVSGLITTQMTTASVGQTNTANVPCTPASAGVDTVTGHRPTNFIPVSFAEFLTVPSGSFGTVTIDLNFNVPKGFVLKELTAGTDPTVATNWFTVDPCVSGLPASGDSCVFDKKNLPKGGLEYILHVLGSSFDPKYSG
jgi:hypothetical protein